MKWDMYYNDELYMFNSFTTLLSFTETYAAFMNVMGIFANKSIFSTDFRICKLLTDIPGHIVLGAVKYHVPLGLLSAQRLITIDKWFSCSGYYIGGWELRQIMPRQKKPWDERLA